MYDFNDAPAQFGDLIPAGTMCKVGMMIQYPQGAMIGNDPALTRSNSSDAQYLSADFIVIGGPFNRRHIFQNLTMIGGKTDSSGKSKAGNISRSTIRAILESARNIDPRDNSPQAQQARQIASYGDLVGLEIAVKVGIEKGTGGYEDKNKILMVITPDQKEYAAIMAGETIAASQTTTTAASSQPPAAATKAWQQGGQSGQPPASGPAPWQQGGASPAQAQTAAPLQAQQPAPPAQATSPANGTDGIPRPSWAQ